MFLDLEHQVLKILREQKIENVFILVALSGGLDSVVLLSVLSSLKGILRLKLKACYVHHGFSSKPNLWNYRQKAQQFCHDFCKEAELSFVALGSEVADELSSEMKTELKTEEELREFRHQLLREQLQEETSMEAERWLALAHHGDDLLETRLHRLIRGTGLEGLEAMKLKEAPLLRPLLNFTREELLHYATGKNLKWLEDPSNQDERYFRSWLRNRWIPELEKRQVGAKRALARSLELILKNSIEEDLSSSLFLEQDLCRREFERLNLKDQKRAIAQYLSRLGCRNFSYNQIVEIIKQLDIPRKKHTFTAAQCQWVLSAARISATKSKAYLVEG